MELERDCTSELHKPAFYSTLSIIIVHCNYSYNGHENYCC